MLRYVPLSIVLLAGTDFRAVRSILVRWTCRLCAQRAKPAVFAKTSATYMRAGSFVFALTRLGAVHPVFTQRAFFLTLNKSERMSKFS